MLIGGHFINLGTKASIWQAKKANTDCRCQVTVGLLEILFQGDNFETIKEKINYIHNYLSNYVKQKKWITFISIPLRKIQSELAIRNKLPSTESFLTASPFLYCEFTSFLKFNFHKHQHSVIESFYTIAESLIASSDCMLITSSRLNYTYF